MQYPEPGDRRRLQRSLLWRLVPLQRSCSGTRPRLLLATFPTPPFFRPSMGASYRPWGCEIPGTRDQALLVLGPVGRPRRNHLIVLVGRGTRPRDPPHARPTSFTCDGCGAVSI